MLLTFSGILKYNKLPLASVLKEVLEISQKEMNKPVEIEFAVNISHNPSERSVLNLLQIRPIVENHEEITQDISLIPDNELLISSNMSLGNGLIEDVYDIIYVNHEQFDSSKNEIVASMIDEINERMTALKKNYILIGPGRWGSSDPWLGIPVKWAQISAARLIIETALENYMVDPSQGTHFFQNLTSFKVGYLTINEPHNQGFIDWKSISKLPVIFQNQYINPCCLSKTVLPYYWMQNKESVE